MKTTLVSLALLCLILTTHGQIPPIFSNLNLANATSGHFWDKTPSSISPPGIDSFQFLKFDATSEIILNMNLAKISATTSVVPLYAQLRENLEVIKRTEHVIPICILEMNYDQISPSAQASGLLFYSNNAFYQTNYNQSVFTTKTTLVLHIDAEDYGENDLKFKLSNTNYFQNCGGLPDVIKIDFNNGSGWQIINPGQTINVHYSSTDIDRNIKLQTERNGIAKKSGFLLKSNDCQSTYDHPILPTPWPTDNNSDRPWQISALLEDGISNVCGNAYYLPHRRI